MKRIMFATDFSEGAKNAFNYLLEMTIRSNVQIHIVNVFDVPTIGYSGYPYYPYANLINEKKEIVESRLNELLGIIPTFKRGEIHAAFGMYPSSLISELAKENDCDLIVMALRDNSNVIQRIIGTTTAHTITKTAIPVLAIPFGAKFKPIKNILMPVDHSPNAKISDEESQILNILFDLFEQRFEPSIHLIHVDPETQQMDVTYENNPFKSTDFTVIHERSVEEGIINHVERANIDLISMHKPNRKFWERIYHNSVTNKVLIKTKTPILIV